jgi:predicted  nucleic acid-binding Zn-ribbon protein
MAHPVIEEINRCYHLNNVRDIAFRRWQRLLRDEVQPMLDEREKLIEENAALLEQIRLLRNAVEAYEQAAPVKRGPGRPRKEEATTV